MHCSVIKTSLLIGACLAGMLTVAIADDVVWQCDVEQDGAPQACGLQAGDHVQRVAEDLAAGQFCLKHPAVKGNAWNMVQMTSEDKSPYRPVTSIKTAEGMLYRLSVQSRNTLTQNPAIGFRILKGEKTSGYAWQTLPAGQNTWQYGQLLLEPEDGTTELQVYLRSSGEEGNGCVWWDQVTVEAVPAATWGTPQTAALTMVPMDSVVFEKTQSNTPIRLKLTAGAAAIGTQLNVAVQPTYVSGDAVWSYQQHISAPGRIEVSMPAAALPKGHYTLTITSDGCNGQSMHIEKPIAVIDAMPFGDTKPQPVHTSLVDDDGLWRINGQPCLIIKYSHDGSSVEQLIQMRTVYGATATTIWTPAGTDQLYQKADSAWQAGVYSLVALFHPVMYDHETKTWKLDVLREIVEKLKDHPGVIGWNLIDEPDGGSVPPENVKAAYDLIRSIDTNHIIWVNLCLPDKFGDYIAYTDLASYDHYPLPDGLEPITEYNDKIKAVCPRPMPLVSYLQTYATGQSRMPSPLELRAELYQIIADGARHMFPYYSWTDPITMWSLMRDPELKSYTRLLNTELFALQPFLFSNETLSDPIAQLDAVPLRYLARKVDGHIMLAVVNLTANDYGTVSFTLPWPKTIDRVDTWFEDGRTPQRTGNTVSDTFGPYDVHIYEFNTSPEHQL